MMRLLMVVKVWFWNYCSCRLASEIFFRNVDANAEFWRGLGNLILTRD